MKTIKISLLFALIFMILGAFLPTGAAVAQLLHVESVTVDTTWNSDSILYDGNGIMTGKIESRDCRISFVPQGEGMAQMLISISIDSGRTWSLQPNYLLVLNNGFANAFLTGQRDTIVVRVLGSDRAGVAFKMTARQAAPVIKGNPKTTILGIAAALTPGQNTSVPLSLSLPNLSSNSGFCPLARVYWDALGDGSIDDSTVGPNVLTWTWTAQIPSGPTAQKRGVIVRAIDKNGLTSTPETLVVQFGLKKPIVMKSILAGVFSMGQVDIPWPIDAQPHQVTLSAFRLQETEVTQEQYQTVMGTNPSAAVGTV
jgi:hypothetical protein